MFVNRIVLNKGPKKIVETLLYIGILIEILAGATILTQELAGFVSVSSVNVFLAGYFMLFILVYICCLPSSIRFRGIVGMSVPFAGLFPLVVYMLFLLFEFVDAVYVMSGVKHIFMLMMNVVILVVYFMISVGIRGRVNGLRFYLSPYVHVSLYLVVAGVITTLLVQAGVVDLNAWVENTGFMKKSGEAMYGDYLYSWPYYLSFVLAGADQFQLLGLPFYRLSGLSIEPAVASYFTAPFLFFIPYYYHEKYMRYCVTFLVVVYLFFVASLTNYLALLVVFSLIVLVHFKRYVKYIVPAIMALIVGLFAGDVGLFDVGFKNHSEVKSLFSRLETPSAQYVLESRSSDFDADNLFGHGTFYIFYDKDVIEDIYSGKYKHGILSLFMFYVLCFMLLGYSFVGYYGSADRPRRYASLALMYVVIHAFKSPPHIYSFNFTVYMFIVVGMMRCFFCDQVASVKSTSATYRIPGFIQ